MKQAVNQTVNTILGRRSIRTYAPGEINPETVKVLLEAAMAAPSAMTKDPWRFVLVRDQSMLCKLKEALPGGRMLPSAAMAIVVCGDLDAAFEGHISYLLQDCSAAIENLLLCAHSLDLGACWVGIHPDEKSLKRVQELLSLPTRIVPVCSIALGLPGEQLESRTRYREDYIHSEKW
jgi:nitroreductase